MGHLIAAAGAVEAAVCALAIHHGTLPVNANLRELDPDCDVDIVRDAAARAPRARGAVQFARLRRLEQLPRLPPSGRCRRARRASADSAATMKTPRIVITGTGAICGSGRTPDEILGRAARGHARRSARSTQWDASALAGAASPPRCRDYNAGALTGDRKLLKLIRRTDVFGLYAADRAHRAVRLRRLARHRSTRPRPTRFADRTGVFVGSGGGSFSNQYDYFR